MTRYIKFKRIARKIKKLDCEHINDWIDTCTYKKGDFIGICEGDGESCGCDDITSLLQYRYEFSNTYCGEETLPENSIIVTELPEGEIIK